jgi:hypothetical protein
MNKFQKVGVNVSKDELGELLKEFGPPSEDWLYVQIELKWKDGRGKGYEFFSYDPGIGRKPYEGESLCEVESIPDKDGQNSVACDRAWREVTLQTSVGTIVFRLEED